MSLAASRWMFALKLYLAAMLAYLVAVHLAFPQSYWAVVTCCALMNPLSGAIRSKAMYRASGTVAAGFGALLLASALADAPSLLLACAGLVSVFAFGVAVLDRTPRAYGFQLFAVTLLLIVASGIDQPQNMFDTAVARICEIGVGLLSCTVVDSILAPRSLAPVMRNRMRSWLKDMQAWIDDTLSDRPEGAVARYDRHRIIADLTALSTLAGQLGFDPFVQAQERQAVFAIQRRLLRMVPLLSAIESHAAAWTAEEKATFRDWKRAVALRARAGQTADPALESMQEKQPGQAWSRLIRRNFIDLTTDLLSLWAETRQIADFLERGAAMPQALARDVRASRPFPLWPDFNLAVRVSAGILIAFGTICVLWWATAWTNGASALIMGMVAIAFFGNADKAEQAIGTFLRFAALGSVLGGVLAYGLLPLAENTELFFAVMALVILPIGAWAVTQPRALLMLALAIGNANLQAGYAAKGLDGYLSDALATLIGIFLGQLCIALVRETSPAHAVQRLVQQQRREVQAIARGARGNGHDIYISRSLDRAAGIVSRSASHDDRARRVLAALRGGAAIGRIRPLASRLGGELRTACETILADVYQAREAIRTPQLRAHIDHALSAAYRAGDAAPQGLMRALIGLRLAWFEEAPPPDLSI